MNTKEKKHSKPRGKKPKPNLHGPNSPTPKKKYVINTTEENYIEEKSSEEKSKSN